LTFPNLTDRISDDKTLNCVVEQESFLTMKQMMIQHIYKSLKQSKGKIDGPGGVAELLAMNPSTLRAGNAKLGD